MTSIRFPFRVFNRRADKKRLVDSVPQANGCTNRHSQMANSANSRCNTSAFSRYDNASRQHDVNQTAIISERWTDLEKNHRSFDDSFNGNELGGTALTHRQLLLLIDENGEAYDMAGRKWSLA